MYFHLEEKESMSIEGMKAPWAPLYWMKNENAIIVPIILALKLRDTFLNKHYGKPGT